MKLPGYSFEELYEMRCECLERFERKQEEVVSKALTGEITKNTEMVKALKELNREYLLEAEDYEDFPSDLNPNLISYFEKAHENEESVIDKAKFFLGLLDYSRNGIDKDHFLCKDGLCDEHGYPLCDDGEHRPFDVIKGESSKD